ncbi:DJ-1/PfpI family protein [Streptomyces sp. H10-C2]|uniref:DJ-1/PfpI family protein n=1 Tax=unclassified Streptomyces TaxID=2593676 RepID=UPI0024BAA0DC|nr:MULTISPECIES: DJ-1/PfpI family protein [unclassified Streptomyces]MDJ0343645.1 DJ-1/PfpI family protein [Streptomyces sp. PH10-H1]MDJ0373107.1 DJ-1/PfpI family protein [Streptomyces sp. H10-C2]
MTHPYWEFTEAGYEVTIASPDGGSLAADGYSDPRDDSGYSAEIDVAEYDAVLLVGGQGPMYPYRGNPKVSGLVVEAYESGKVVAVV